MDASDNSKKIDESKKKKGNWTHHKKKQMSVNRPAIGSSDRAELKEEILEHLHLTRNRTKTLKHFMPKGCGKVFIRKCMGNLYKNPNPVGLEKSASKEELKVQLKNEIGKYLEENGYMKLDFDKQLKKAIEHFKPPHTKAVIRSAHYKLVFKARRNQWRKKKRNMTKANLDAKNAPAPKKNTVIGSDSGSNTSDSGVENIAPSGSDSSPVKLQSKLGKKKRTPNKFKVEVNVEQAMKKAVENNSSQVSLTPSPPASQIQKTSPVTVDKFPKIKSPERKSPEKSAVSSPQKTQVTPKLPTLKGGPVEEVNVDKTPEKTAEINEPGPKKSPDPSRITPKAAERSSPRKLKSSLKGKKDETFVEPSTLTPNEKRRVSFGKNQIKEFSNSNPKVSKSSKRETDLIKFTPAKDLISFETPAKTQATESIDNDECPQLVEAETTEPPKKELPKFSPRVTRSAAKKKKA